MIVRSGGTVVNRFANSGKLQIGGDDTGQVGIMMIEDNASVRHTELNLQTYGSLTFEFGANSISTFNSTRTTTGGANTLDGLLTLDLGALTEVGTYTLVDSSDADLLINGALKTWLDADGGTRSGTGNIAETNFEIINNTANYDWSLTTANGGQDLTFTVAIPEPNSFALFTSGLMVALVFVCRQRYQV
jgi:hypothetical protein